MTLPEKQAGLEVGRARDVGSETLRAEGNIVGVAS